VTELRSRWREAVRGAAPAAGCPESERFWDAACGSLTAREVCELADHAAQCPACADAWALARELREGSGAAVPRMRGRSARWLWVPGLVAATLLVLLVARRETVEPGLQVTASLIRFVPGGTEERMPEPVSLVVGDRVGLAVEADAPAYVYVVSIDSAGHGALLFPLPGLESTNPLPAARRHLLPGRREGRPMAWPVETASGREELLVVAAYEPWAAMEQLAAAAGRDALALALPDDLGVHLRGIGDATPDPSVPAPPRIAGPTLPPAGAWVRRVEIRTAP
jgi:Domain of unknown function (DUF4384)